MPNPKYQCLCCDYSSTQAYFVSHLVKSHPESFLYRPIINDKEGPRTKSFEGAAGSKKLEEVVSSTLVYPVRNYKVKLSETVRADRKNEYPIFCCLACNKFYAEFSKAKTHLENSKECRATHIQRAKDLMAAAKEATGEVVEEKPVAPPADSNKIAELEEKIRMMEQNALLSEKKIRKLQADLAVAQETVDRLEESEKANEGDGLKDQLEYQKILAHRSEYKYQRLRYHLLMGVMREWCPYTQREKTVPLINTEYRRKLITLLEENDLLPIHKLGEEMWRTDLFYNAETIPPYKFPIEYEKLYDDE